MARKRIETAGIKFGSWEEVDAAMRELCVKERERTLITGAMNEKIDAAKREAEEQAKPIRDEVERIEKGIMDYATEHREDMGKLKSKKLNFGTVYFRKSTKIRVPAAAEKVAEIIRRLRDRGMVECINQPAAKVNKDALRAYSPETIVDVGASIDVSDEFSYELDQTKIEGN